MEKEKIILLRKAIDFLETNLNKLENSIISTNETDFNKSKKESTVLIKIIEEIIK